MLYNTKEGKINTENASFDYIQFGTGKKTLIMLQGLNTNGIKGVIQMICESRQKHIFKFFIFQ